MPIITLTSDMGEKDFYASAVKGAILSRMPEAQIVDVSHSVAQFDIQEAAYILKNAFPNFPAGSVHIVGVRTAGTPDTPHIALQSAGHYFIGADNGIFSLLLDKMPDRIVELNIKSETSSKIFPVRDVFVQAACHLARGGTLEIIGREMKKFSERMTFQPSAAENFISGTVIYVDTYGNIITNITERLFKEIGKGRPFSVNLSGKELDDITKISLDYSDVQPGKALALFSLSGYLEIAINEGKASYLLGARNSRGSSVRVEFSGK